MRRFQPRGAVAMMVLAFACALHACGSVGVRIVAPIDGAVGTLMPLDIELDINAAAVLASLDVRLNGVDISDQFAFGPVHAGRLRAKAVDVWAPGLMIDGLNQLIVQIEYHGRTGTRERYFLLEGDPYADAVPAGGFQVGIDGGFGSEALVLGAPAGGGLFQGSLDVLSLGLGGTIELEFTDNVVIDGPGADLSVFENSFLGIDPGPFSAPPFSEPGRVSVSQDGVTWYAFACNLVLIEAPYHPGCAGVYPVLSDQEDPHASLPTPTPIEDLVGLDLLEPLPAVEGAGGDSFDLADVGLAWAAFVRIEAASFVDGPSGPTTSGFDLDAVAAIHSAAADDLNGNGIPDGDE